MNAHRKLDAWQACIDLIKAIYRLTRSFPVEERYALTSQLRRAAVSSASNIAEGWARTGDKETAHGISIALGSLAEVDTLLVVAEGESYISQRQLSDTDTLLVRASQLTSGLLRKVRSRIKD